MTTTNTVTQLPTVHTNALRTILEVFDGAEIIEADDIGDHAIEYAVRGWQVFPCRGKAPAVGNPHPKGSHERTHCKGECGRDGHGVLDATTDHDQVVRWWRRHRDANIGGRVPEHVFVLDVDIREDGHIKLEALTRQNGALPATLTAESGTGGRHYYFRAPDAKLKGLIVKGLDIKTHAGYTVLPPSIHPDSNRPYRWLTSDPIADPPNWLLDLVVKQPNPIQPVKQYRPDFSSSFSGSTIDDFTNRTSWSDLLAGWECLSPDGDADGAQWRHPSATAKQSATVRHGCLFVYSSNTEFPQTEAGSPSGITKFRAFAILHHGGDTKAAFRVLRGAV